MKKTNTCTMCFGSLLGKCLALGVLTIAVSACVADTSPPHQGYSYDNGSYSTYSGDYDSFAADRDADERNGLGHSDDRNFHNRDDYDQYDH